MRRAACHSASLAPPSGRSVAPSAPAVSRASRSAPPVCDAYNTSVSPLAAPAATAGTAASARLRRRRARYSSSPVIVNSGIVALVSSITIRPGIPKNAPVCSGRTLPTIVSPHGRAA